MSTQKCTVTPHILNICLKRIKNIITHGDYDRAVDEADTLIARKFDPEFFTAPMVELITDRLDMVIIFLWSYTESAALEMIQHIRKTVLDPIFVKNLWLANRILNEKKRDIGTLDELPDLVQFEIRRILYSAL